MPFKTVATVLGMTGRRLGRRRRHSCGRAFQLPPQFFILYVTATVLYVGILGSYVIPSWRSRDRNVRASNRGLGTQHPRPVTSEGQASDHGRANLPTSEAVLRQQRVLCRYRADAMRTIIAHMHIPKSGGTAFALALKSECRCRKIPRPKKGFCKECPHVLPDPDSAVVTLRQNLWTFQNESFSPPYTANCRTFKASSGWFGFQRRNHTYTFYSQNRLTSGWPCGVHVGYARLRMCCHRLQLPGIKHVVVTLFREPLARFVSEFFQVAYNRRVISSWDWCMNRVPPLSMTEFFAMPVSFPFQSRMTKLLSGSPVQTGAAGRDWTIPGVREQALERALRVVESTEDFLFGLVEELDLTLEMFHFVFRRSFKSPSSCHSHQNSSSGGCSHVELGLHNLNGQPLKLNDGQKMLFDKGNYEDMVVYESASEIFYERIAAMRSLKSLGSDLAIDRRCARLINGD